MRKWKRFLSVFFVLHFFTCSPLGGQTWAASRKSLVLSSSATRKSSTSKTTSAKPQVNAARSTAAKTNAEAKLTDRELKKYELSGIHKKDWAQRLQWFESKIIDRYKAMNKKNILVVGEQKFLDAFKDATRKHNCNANFTYMSRTNFLKINEWGMIQ